MQTIIYRLDKQKGPTIEPVSVCVCVCVCAHACSVAQSCLTLCNPMNCSPPGSSVHGIFQARILEQVAVSYSRDSFWPRDQTHVFCVSCIGKQILYHCATWEAPLYSIGNYIPYPVISHNGKELKELLITLLYSRFNTTLYTVNQLYFNKNFFNYKITGKKSTIKGSKI